ncbi:SAM-dependent chlorinase/fluorinase [bacterium]|nr:SAM-dependent chlorinase/fluorinase [bacterium]
MRPVFILTDFGLQDAFVGIMKAVVFRLSPESPIFDLTHAVPPQNVQWGALVLEDALPYLPDNAVVCAVVDPGVGSQRQAIAVEVGGRSLIAPDNGLLWPALQRTGEPFHAFALKPGQHIRPQDSATFHGRDVFAPAAALRAAGVPAEEIGTPIEEIQRLEFPQPEADGEGALRLAVLAIDHFGNLTLNLRKDNVPEWLREESATFSIAGVTIRGIRRTFGDVAPGDAVVYWNSAGRLEVGVNRGSACEFFAVKPGAKILMSNEESG